MTVVGSRPAPTCPTWCTADHEAELQRRREMAEDTARSLAADGLFVNPVPDTYRMHTAESGGSWCAPRRRKSAVWSRLRFAGARREPERLAALRI